MSELPILYSFRRCPYAMRARLAIAACQLRVELREIILRAKPDEMLEASPKGTVPVLILPDGQVLEQSFDIMMWALQKNDPNALLPKHGSEQFSDTMALIERFDDGFKHHLDRYKYAVRHVGEGDDIYEFSSQQRANAMAHISALEERLKSGTFLFGESQTLADLAILPFIRQFANVDLSWFLAQPYPNVLRWLDDFISSNQFAAIMPKYPCWKRGAQAIKFPS